MIKGNFVEAILDLAEWEWFHYRKNEIDPLEEAYNTEKDFNQRILISDKIEKAKSTLTRVDPFIIDLLCTLSGGGKY
jgi:hypothetical protein